MRAAAGNGAPIPNSQQQQMMIRPRLMYPPSSSPAAAGGPPMKKIKIEEQSDDCQMISMQPRRDGLPVIHSVQGGGPTIVSASGGVGGGGASSTRASPSAAVGAAVPNEIQLSDQITLSVKGNNVKNPKDVANILANRGITVTPTAKSSASANDKPADTTAAGTASTISTATTTTTTSPPATSASLLQTNNASTNEAVQKIQLNSSVSIISKKKPSTTATIDLSNDDEKVEMLPPLPMPLPPPPPQNRGIRGGVGGKTNVPVLVCPVVNCNRRFVTHEGLNLHTRSGHRGVVKKAYRCKFCPNKFASLQSLLLHQRNVHRVAMMPTTATSSHQLPHAPLSRATTADELGLPVVDLRNEDTRNKLAALGIVNYIPLANLNRNTGGQYGLPIVSVQGAANAAVCNLAAIGADSILSIGTVKQVPRMRPAL